VVLGGGFLLTGWGWGNGGMGGGMGWLVRGGFGARLKGLVGWLVRGHRGPFLVGRGSEISPPLMVEVEVGWGVDK